MSDLDAKQEETIHEGPRFTVKRGTFGSGDDEFAISASTT